MNGRGGGCACDRACGVGVAGSAQRRGLASGCETGECDL